MSLNKLDDTTLKHGKYFDDIYKRQDKKRGTNNKRYNMVNCSAVVGFAQYAQVLTPSLQFTIPEYQDYVVTGLIRSHTLKNRAGTVTGISDVRLILFDTNRKSLTNNFNLNNDNIFVQFYNQPRIDLRLPIFSNFNIDVFALQEGNFVVGDIVDVSLTVEFEYIGLYD